MPISHACAAGFGAGVVDGMVAATLMCCEVVYSFRILSFRAFHRSTDCQESRVVRGGGRGQALQHRLTSTFPSSSLTAGPWLLEESW